MKKYALLTHYVRKGCFANWTIQTDTIDVPIKFAVVIQKSVENLKESKKMTIK